MVYGPVPSHRALKVTLRGWTDVWVVFPYPSTNKPYSITPNFVRKAIEFGLAQGWTPDAKGTAFEIEWRDEEFCVPTKLTEETQIQPDDSRNTNSA